MTEHDLLRQAVLAVLEETFENAQGIYLDESTSLFETLTMITAQEASVPVSTNCASIAAQVEHVIYFMDMLLQVVRGEKPDVDWSYIWNNVQAVTEEEWANSQTRLRETYQHIRQLVMNAPGMIQVLFEVLWAWWRIMPIILVRYDRPCVQSKQTNNNNNRNSSLISRLASWVQVKLL